MNEEFTLEEAKIVYQSKEGKAVAASDGIVVSIDTTMTDALKLEGNARELIRAIQQMRKDAGMEFTDTVKLTLKGADEIMKEHGELVLEETRSVMENHTHPGNIIDIGELKITIGLEKKM